MCDKKTYRTFQKQGATISQIEEHKTEFLNQLTELNDKAHLVFNSIIGAFNDDGIPKGTESTPQLLNEIFSKIGSDKSNPRNYKDLR